MEILDLKDQPTFKLYSVAEKYCALRVKKLNPEQAYRIAKGLNNNEEVKLRTIQYNESRYRKLCLDARTLPEIKEQAVRTYQNILRGKGRDAEKVTKDGDVVEYKEFPGFAVMADLAKDTLEHNNPTIRKSQNLNINADIKLIDLSNIE